MSEGTELFWLLWANEAWSRTWAMYPLFTPPSLSSISQEFRNCWINAWTWDCPQICSLLVLSRSKFTWEWISFRFCPSEKKYHRVALDFILKEMQVSGMSNQNASMSEYGSFIATLMQSISSSKLCGVSVDHVWKTTNALSVAAKQHGIWFKPPSWLTVMQWVQTIRLIWTFELSTFSDSLSWSVEEEEQPMISSSWSGPISK